MKTAYFFGGLAVLTLAGMCVASIAVVGFLAYAIATSSPSSPPVDCSDGICPPVENFTWTAPSLGPEPDYYKRPGG
ncbi:MAG: hypothetical protein VX090_08360 [Pseudomonadota bacterium]|nr:hypothetical protein [Pseudomonadota bacterium]